MNEFKGTKGEWRIYHDENKNLISLHIGESTDEIDLGNHNYLDPTICGIWYSDFENSMANANLMCAAPKLLSALQLCINLLEDIYTDADVSPTLKIAKDAVNKALGL